MTYQRLIVTIAVMLVAVAGLFANAELNQLKEFDESATVPAEPIELDFEQATAFIQIENPFGKPATLYRIDGNDRIEVQKLDPSRQRHCFLAPSGFYLVSCDSGLVDYPIPALTRLVGEEPVIVRLESAPSVLPINPGKTTALQSEIEWCWIPPGPAVTGDTLGIGSEDERPLRISEVSGFWMSKFEITNQQYADFLSAQEEIDERWIDFTSRKCRIQKNVDVAGKVSFESDAPDLPVVMVSFYGARAWCRWRTRETGCIHRLPVEVEWEKAARGPESFVYSYGNVYRQSLANQESGQLKPVGLYLPNSYGLHDLTGNVFEWMADQHDPERPGRHMNQSLRGGSFVLDGMYLRNSFRMRQSPAVMTDDIGFRVVCEPINSKTGGRDEKEGS